MNTGSRHGPPLIGALLRMPWENVHERMLAGLRERGFTDLGAAHLSVLQWPGPDGLRPSELAARIRMSKQALNYLLGQLERLGYLQRHDDPRDQRFKRIALTDRGRRAAKAMRDIVREVETDWERQLGPERFAQLRLLLTDLNNHVAADRTRADSDQEAHRSITSTSAPPPSAEPARART
jgi:DNA-binding MarR family transcriptional regulator